MAEVLLTKKANIWPNLLRNQPLMCPTTSGTKHTSCLNQFNFPTKSKFHKQLPCQRMHGTIDEFAAKTLFKTPSACDQFYCSGWVHIMIRKKRLHVSRYMFRCF